MSLPQNSMDLNNFIVVIVGTPLKLSLCINMAWNLDIFLSKHGLDYLIWNYLGNNPFYNFCAFTGMEVTNSLPQNIADCERSLSIWSLELAMPRKLEMRYRFLVQRGNYQNLRCIIFSWNSQGQSLFPMCIIGNGSHWWNVPTSEFGGL